MLALAAFGLRKSFLLFFRFPGAILLPMFTPFTFGPVIGSCSPCCGCCKTESECDFKLAKSPMELSFTFSYVNVIISALGALSFFFTTVNWNFKASEVPRTVAVILGTSVIQLAFIGIFHLFEKKCLCCCNFCFPFTNRETFDIGDAPDLRVEEKAIDLENLGKGVLMLKGIYFQFGPKSRKLL